MKKTIIAASIAAVVAAPAAFADVKISGQLNYELYSQDSNNTNTGDLGEDLNTDVVISGSEDLGNGMKVSFKLAGSPDGTTEGFGDDQTLTFSGDFGSLKVGRAETFIENKVRAMAANDTSDAFGNEVAGDMGQRSNGMFEYVSPSFSGVKLYISGNSYDANTSHNDDFDMTSVGIEYSNAGLTVRAATADGYDRTSGSANTLTTTKSKEEALAISYKMGDFTVAAVTASQKNAGSAETDETWYGASYAMGSNTISASSNSDSNVDTFSVKHSLSKSTSIGLTHQAAAASADDVTVVTIAHKF